MRLARKFKLINNTGSEFDLSVDSDRKVFLSGPTGLGLSVNISSERIADGFFITSSSYKEQGSIAGNIIFLENGYRAYREFIEYINNSEELKIAYQPGGEYEEYYNAETGNVEYLEDWYISFCRLTKLEKSEMSPNYSGALVCPIEFTLMSAWSKNTVEVRTIGFGISSLEYRKDDETTPVDSSSYIALYAKDDGEVSPGYPSNYIFKYGKDVSSRVTFNISGDLGGAYVAVLNVDTGDPNIKLNNPEFVLYSTSTSTELARIQISASGTDGFITGEKIEISTRPENPYIRKRSVNNSTVVDLSDKISIAVNPFARPLNGENYFEFVTNVIYDSTMSLSVEIYDYYRSV